MKNWTTCIGGEQGAKALAGMKMGLGFTPQRESSASGTVPELTGTRIGRYKQPPPRSGPEEEL